MILEAWGNVVAIPLSIKINHVVDYDLRGGSKTGQVNLVESVAA